MSTAYDDGSHCNDPGGPGPNPAKVRSIRPPLQGLPMIGPATADLMRRPIVPMRWAPGCAGLLPHDLHLVSAAPKSGKSRFAKMCAIKISSSDETRNGQPVKSLYITPDDTNEAGWGQDINELLGGAEFDPSRLIIRTAGIRRLGEGLEEDIAAELDADPAIGHVFIDVLNSVKPRKRESDDIQAEEHKTMRNVAELQEQYDIGLSLLTHTNKRAKGGSTRSERIAGSNGLLGGVPTYITLERDEVGSGVEFFMRGRYLKSDALFRFNLSDLSVDWTPPLQDAFDGTLSPEEAAKLLTQEAELALAERESEEAHKRPHVPGPIEVKVLEVLADGQEHAPKPIAEIANLRRVTVRWHLRRMLERGQVELVAGGVYRLPQTPQTCQTPGDEAAWEAGNEACVGDVGDVGPQTSDPPPVVFAYAWGGEHMPAPREVCHICGAQHWENVGGGVYCGSRRCAGRTPWRGPTPQEE